jgi:hypothetical protein
MRRPQQHEAAASPLRSGVASRLDESARLVALARATSTPGYWQQAGGAGSAGGVGGTGGGAYAALPPPPPLLAENAAAQAAFGARLAALALADAEEARVRCAAGGNAHRASEQLLYFAQTR